MERVEDDRGQVGIDVSDPLVEWTGSRERWRFHETRCRGSETRSAEDTEDMRREVPNLVEDPEGLRPPVPDLFRVVCSRTTDRGQVRNRLVGARGRGSVRTERTSYRSTGTWRWEGVSRIRLERSPPKPVTDELMETKSLEAGVDPDVVGFE